tara:strand:+ start:33 stop:500 length:468 start_codon:yes stop_codon:yes gene_type:complete
MFKISQIFLSLVFIGYLKWAPGTIASIFSILIIYVLYHILNDFTFILIFIFLIFISIILINIFLKKIKKNDPQEIVIDEFLGIYLIFIFYDNYNFEKTQITIILIFLLFRFFDILKPFPINIVDKKMKNSIGIILDDLIASIYSIISLYLIYAYI